jgi:hypothetical protein
MVDKARRTSKQASNAVDVIAQDFSVASARMKNANGHRFLRVNTMHLCEGVAHNLAAPQNVASLFSVHF